MRTVRVESYAAQPQGSDKWRAVIEIREGDMPRERYICRDEFETEDQAGEIASARADYFLRVFADKHRARRVFELIKGGKA